MDFFSALELHAPRAHLLAKGELDAFAAVGLRRRLDEAVDRGCLHFTVDASTVTFVDAGGLGTLVRLVNTVAPFGGTVMVVATSPRFRQVAELVGLEEVLGIDLLPNPLPPERTRVTRIARGQHRTTSHRRRSVDATRVGEAQGGRSCSAG